MPQDVLGDRALSSAQKRMILSSWASDRYAVEDYPWLRQIPGSPLAISLKDIMAALRKLDRHDDYPHDHPPRGAGALRPLRPERVAASHDASLQRRSAS